VASWVVGRGNRTDCSAHTSRLGENRQHLGARLISAAAANPEAGGYNSGRLLKAGGFKVGKRAGGSRRPVMDTACRRAAGGDPRPSDVELQTKKEKTIGAGRDEERPAASLRRQGGHGSGWAGAARAVALQAVSAPRGRARAPTPAGAGLRGRGSVHGGLGSTRRQGPGRVVGGIGIFGTVSAYCAGNACSYSLGQETQRSGDDRRGIKLAVRTKGEGT